MVKLQRTGPIDTVLAKRRSSVYDVGPSLKSQPQPAQSLCLPESNNRSD